MTPAPAAWGCREWTRRVAAGGADPTVGRARRAHSARHTRDDGDVDTTTPPGRPQAQDLSEVERRLLPLLRELWEFGMLQRAGNGPDRYWRLSPSASAQLDDLVSAATAHAARPAMAFGYHCDGCGRRAVTWLVGDEHRCADCGGQPDAGRDAVVVQPLSRNARPAVIGSRDIEEGEREPGTREAGDGVAAVDISTSGDGRTAASA